MSGEFDLDQWWDAEQPQAEAYFQKAVNDRLPELVRQQSRQALARLRRIMLWEWIIGIVLLIGALVLYWDNIRQPWLLGGGLLYFLLCIPPYWSVLRGIRAVPAHDVRMSLVAYRRVIQQYLWRVRVYIWVGTLMGFLVGFYLRVSDDATTSVDVPWGRLVIVMGLALLIAGLMDWMMRRCYFALTYNPILEQLEELDLQLQEQ